MRHGTIDIKRLIQTTEEPLKLSFWILLMEHHDEQELISLPGIKIFLLSSSELLVQTKLGCFIDMFIEQQVWTEVKIKDLMTIDDDITTSAKFCKSALKDDNFQLKQFHGKLNNIKLVTKQHEKYEINGISIANLDVKTESNIKLDVSRRRAYDAKAIKKVDSDPSQKTIDLTADEFEYEILHHWSTFQVLSYQFYSLACTWSE